MNDASKLLQVILHYIGLLLSDLANFLLMKCNYIWPQLRHIWDKIPGVRHSSHLSTCNWTTWDRCLYQVWTGLFTRSSPGVILYIHIGFCVIQFHPLAIHPTLITGIFFKLSRKWQLQYSRVYKSKFYPHLPGAPCPYKEPLIF